mgnify:CR=1 FL=1
MTSVKVSHFDQSKSQSPRSRFPPLKGSERKITIVVSSDLVREMQTFSLDLRKLPMTNLLKYTNDYCEKVVAFMQIMGELHKEFE